MADKVLRLFVGLFVGVYVARYLGPEKFGTLQFAMSFVALFGAFAKLGLDGIVVRNAVQDPDSRDELLGTAFGLRVIGGLVLLGVVFGGVQLTGSEPLTQLIVMIIAVGHVLQAFQVIEFYFQSQVLARLAAIAGVAGLLASAAFRLALIWSDAALIWFALAVIVEHGLKGIALCFLYIKRRIPLWHWRFRLNQAKLLLRDSWPLIFSSMTVAIAMRVDQVMIKFFTEGSLAVGLYAAAVRIAETPQFLPVVISQSLFPALANVDINKRIERYKASIVCFFWIFVFLCLLVCLFAKNIIAIFGSDYSQAYIILQIYIWCLPFTTLNIFTNKMLLIDNLTRFIFYKQCTLAAINVILNIILLKKYGFVGAAIATLSADIFISLFIELFNKNSRYLFFLKLEALIFKYKTV